MKTNSKIWQHFNEAIIAVTYRCNLRCRICNIWQRTDHFEIPKEEYLKLPGSLREINITGGDPFLRPDLVGVIKNIVTACPKAHLSFSSNGYATDLIIQKLKEILKITKNFSIAISLDGLNERHDQIRGREDSYKNALATINKLKGLDLKKGQIKIATTLSDYNVDQLGQLYRLCQELNVEFTLCGTVHNAENYFGIQTNKLTKLTEIKEVLEKHLNEQLGSFDLKKWFRAYFAYGLWQFIITGKRLIKDNAGLSYFFLDPQGNFFANNVASDLLGNINNLAQANFRLLADNDVQSWMICTVRPAIKEHWFKVGYWIISHKLGGYVKL